MLTACGNVARDTQEGIVVTDMIGRSVTVPTDPQSISVLDPYAAPLVVMLGYGDRMPTTINAVRRNILLQSIAPPLAEAVIAKSGGTVNAETILAHQTDLIIVGAETYISADEKAKLDVLDIPYIVVSYSSMADQLAVVDLLGVALQNVDMAQQYISYYQQCIDLVTSGVPEFPTDDLRLYHSVNEATRTDYQGSLCTDWIELMNVTNVSLEATLNMTQDKAYATLEQIYLWDPEIIICNESGVADYILTDSKWQGLGAVIDKEVFQMPIGLSRWGHPTSIETPLAILWLAELLYPDQFDIDIRTEMTDFYEEFYGYTLSEKEADDIITGYGIRTPKTVHTND